MPVDAARSAASAVKTATITCPFCGLLCDDVAVRIDAKGDVDEYQNLCPRGLSQYTSACRSSFDDELGPRIHGEPASLEDAIVAAASVLQSAKTAIVGGLMTDVAGMRAAIGLGEKINAILDHANSQAMVRNLRVMQRNGWFTSTLTEVRNRADMIIIVGDGVHDAFPRLVSRVLRPARAIDTTRLRKRRFVTLSSSRPDSVAADLGDNSSVISIDNDQLPLTINRLRYRLQHQQDNADYGIPAEIVALADEIRQHQYVVFIWSAALLDPVHGDLTIDAVCALVNTLNETQRAAGLPLAGNLADMTANQVMTWQTGVGLRSAFVNHTPRQHFLDYDANYLLENQLADAVLWLSSLAAPSLLPNTTQGARVIVGHPASINEDCDVFIPVAVPGVFAPGVMVRSDGVVSLPVTAVNMAQAPATLLPTTANVIRQIDNALANTP
jgi:formylmethanofuran dehydrogenase subunit B